MPHHPANPPPRLSLQGASADLPLAGMTVLVVEDSRYACEALRLICRHAGARMRRAETLAAAASHLRTYRPDALIVDLGLPDGSGLDLIASLSGQALRPRVVLACSGDGGLRAGALAAGADGFLDKPIDGGRALLAALSVPPLVAGPALMPDLLALRDDLAHAAHLLGQPGQRAYAAAFILGLAGQMRDPDLQRAARQPGLGRLRALLDQRLAADATAVFTGRAPPG